MSFMDTAALVRAGGLSSDAGTKKPMVKLLVQNGLRTDAGPIELGSQRTTFTEPSAAWDRRPHNMLNHSTLHSKLERCGALLRWSIRCISPLPDDRF